jgi:hypothetical protein
MREVAGGAGSDEGGRPGRDPTQHPLWRHRFIERLKAFPDAIVGFLDPAERQFDAPAGAIAVEEDLAAARARCAAAESRIALTARQVTRRIPE